MPTRWEMFVKRWGRGCGSNYCPPRAVNTLVCLARGDVPCDVLFVGEAPGVSENMVEVNEYGVRLGSPFIGPAGHYLDGIIKDSLGRLNQLRREDRLPSLTHCLTNVVGCLPREGDGGKAGEPSDEQVQCCSTRLTEFVALCEPRIIVCVGHVARDWLDTGYKHSVKLRKVCAVCNSPQWLAPGGPICRNGHKGAKGINVPRTDIMHPAWILRQNVAVKGLERQRAVVKLFNVLMGMFHESKEEAE